MAYESSTTALPPCPHCQREHEATLLRCPISDLPLPLEGRLLDGKFRILAPLGTGGMAAVWLAVNEAVDRQVAIKLLRPETARNEELLARFKAEAKAAGRIDNVHICEVLDFGLCAVGPYIVMERLHGQDLATMIKAAGRLEPAWAVWLVRQALAGLEAAHAAGIVHRDLKPANLFLHEPPGASSERDVIVKVMDFGVSKFLDGRGEAETQSGMLLGTPEYMAPEQLKGAGKIDARADVFAVGAILYRALTGKQVFSGPNLAAVLMSMANDRLTPIREHVEGVPPGLAAVVERCLERDPDRRFATAAELSRALAPYDDRAEFGDLRAQRDVARSSPTDHAPTVIYEPTARPPQGRRSLWIMLVAAALLVTAGVAVSQREGGDGERVDAAPVAADEPRAEARVAHDAKPRPVAPAATKRAPPREDKVAVAIGTGEDETLGETSGDELILDDGFETDTPGPGPRTAGAAPDKDRRPPPPGAARGGVFITPIDPGPSGDQKDAARYCEQLAADRHLGIARWSLANPTEARAFVGQRELKMGRYWTSAIHAGRALVIALPSGTKHSEQLDRRARPLCVARY